MRLFNILTSKIGKFFSIIAIVAMLGGCAGVTDAGFNQQADQPAQDTEEIHRDQNNDPETVPFPTEDDPGIIYDDPDA